MRQIRQPRRHRHDRRRRLLLQLRQQRRRQPDRPQQIRRDDRLRIRQILRLRQQILRTHDARVVDHHIQCRILLRHLRPESTNRLRVIDVKLHRPHPRIRRCRRIQRLLPPSRNDHRVAQRLKRLCQPPPDAGAAASNKDGVPCKLHDFHLLLAIYALYSLLGSRHLKVQYLP